MDQLDTFLTVSSFLWYLPQLTANERKAAMSLLYEHIQSTYLLYVWTALFTIVLTLALGFFIIRGTRFIASYQHYKRKARNSTEVTRQQDLQLHKHPATPTVVKHAESLHPQPPSAYTLFPHLSAVYFVLDAYAVTSSSDDCATNLPYRLVPQNVFVYSS